MTIIPELTRRKLASSVVGTAGVDRSGEIIAKSIATASAQIAGDVFNQLAKRQSALDTVEANKQIIDFEITLDEKLRETRVEFADDPIEGVKQTPKVGNELATSFLSGIKSDAVRQSVSRMQQSVIRQRTANMGTWAKGQQVAKAGAELLTSMNKLASNATQVNTLTELSELIDQANKSAVAAQGVLGEKTSKFITDGVKAISSGFLYGQMERNPINAGRLINEGTFSEVFTAKELKSFEEDTRKAVKAKTEVDKFNLLFDVSNNNEAIVNKYNEGSLTLGEIDANKAALTNQGASPEQLEFMDIMRDIFLDTADIDAVDNAEEFSILMDEWHQLQVKQKKGKFSAKGSLEEIVRFQRQAAISHRNKVITKARFNKFMEMTTTPLSDKAEKAKGSRTFGFFGGPRTSLDSGYIKINNWLKSNKLSKDFQAKKEMLIELINRHDDIARLGTEPTFSQMDGIAKTIILDQQKKLVTEDNNIPKEGQLKIDKFGRKIRIFPDGSYIKVK